MGSYPSLKSFFLNLKKGTRLGYSTMWVSIKTVKFLLNEFILSRKLLNTVKSFQIDLLSIK